jgi:type IV pilus assembly protein PilP
MNYHHARISLFRKALVNFIYMMLLLFVFCIQAVPAQTPPQPKATNTADEGKQDDTAEVTKALEDLLASMNMGDFVYQVEDRPDPFMPFIAEKVVQPTEAEIEDNEKLTGMRQFEPGQLNLVAILFTQGTPLAMVEDSSHKGYLIKRGTKIGKSGIVSDILPNEVIIKQLSYSMSKERSYKTVEMILRKEGEK